MAAHVTVMRDGKLHIGPPGPGSGTDVDCQVNTAALVPTTDQPTYDTVCGKVTVAGVTAWVLNLVALQDWRTSGWCKYLVDNTGTKQPFTFTPTGASAPSATGTVWCVPAQFGGAAGQPMAATVNLPLDGQPTFTVDSAPLAAAAAE